MLYSKVESTLCFQASDSQHCGSKRVVGQELLISQITKSGGAHACAKRHSMNNLALESYVAHGCNGLVVRVRSKDAGHRFPLRPYALKVCFNMGLQDTKAVKDTFQAEFKELQRLPSHPNIVALVSEFCEEISDELLAMLRQVCLFVFLNVCFVALLLYKLVLLLMTCLLFTCATAYSSCGRVGRVQTARRHGSASQSAVLRHRVPPANGARHACVAVWSKAACP